MFQNFDTLLKKIPTGKTKESRLLSTAIVLFLLVFAPALIADVLKLLFIDQPVGTPITSILATIFLAPPAFLIGSYLTQTPWQVFILPPKRMALQVFGGIALGLALASILALALIVTGVLGFEFVFVQGYVMGMWLEGIYCIAWGVFVCSLLCGVMLPVLIKQFQSKIQACAAIVIFAILFVLLSYFSQGNIFLTLMLTINAGLGAYVILMLYMQTGSLLFTSLSLSFFLWGIADVYGSSYLGQNFSEALFATPALSKVSYISGAPYGMEASIVLTALLAALAWFLSVRFFKNEQDASK